MCFFSVTVPVFCSFLKVVFPPTAAVAHPAVHGGRISLWVDSPEVYTFFFLFSCADVVWGVIFLVAYLWSTVRNFTWADFWRPIWHVFFFEPSALQHPTKIVTNLFIVLLWAKIHEANTTSSNPLSRIIPCFLLSKSPREEHNYNNPTSLICLWKPLLSSFVLSEERYLEKLATDAQSHFQCKSCFQVPSYLLQQSYR